MQYDFESLQHVIAKILAVKPEDIQLTTPLSGNENWDSFAMLSAVALVTEHTGKQLTVNDMSSLITVADLVNIFTS